MGNPRSGSVYQQMHDKLTAAFSPLELTITDDSAKHKGHAGAPEGGESHFTVRIVADSFTEQSRVARQRQVNQVLAEELAGPVHALSIRALTPAEASASEV